MNSTDIESWDNTDNGNFENLQKQQSKYTEGTTPSENEN